MNVDFAAAMRRATQLTRARDIAGAMRIIQEALTGGRAEDPDKSMSDNAVSRAAPRLSDAASENVAPHAGQVTAETAPDVNNVVPRTARMRKPLGEVLDRLREGRAKIAALGVPLAFKPHRQPPSMPAGAQFLNRSFACAAGARNYKLYIPASAPERPRGLIVMLHGCKQDPDDFAAGTNMNAAAERYGVLVAYPGQPGSANASSCWNWFRPVDQMRGSGEPAIIAGLTREIMSKFSLRRGQVFVAGLSAGGAMAAVMGETYPDLYAGVGIHSGLAFGSANDVVSAFAAMRGETGTWSQDRGVRSSKGLDIRTIVFHGSADATVHPLNAERIITAASPDIAPDQVRRERDRSAGGRDYTRFVLTGADGDPAVEYWLIEGAGHAWSGGSSSGSYTDPVGPDASTEMLRFFFAPPPKQTPDMNATRQK
jgi:poly(hydroxyalkanoate) depolymerase family esterase